MTIARPSLLHQAVEHHARRAAARSAIEVSGRSVNYGELASLMNRTAEVLWHAGIRRHDRVVLLLDNGIEACQAIYGTLRADACFVACNPSYPPQRVAAIAELSEAAALVTSKELLDTAVQAARAMGGKHPGILLLLDGPASLARDALDRNGVGKAFDTVLGADDVEAATGELPPCRNIEEDLAYILFTSGTTSVPKGVMVSHRAVASTIAWGVEHFSITPEDRLSNHSRLSFDVGLFDVFAAAYAGATLLPLVRGGDCAFPGGFIRKNRVTVWFSVPSVINLMLQSRQLEDGPLPSLRAALFAGEPLTPAMAASWMRLQPHVPLYNLYGPTEAAIVCTVHHVGGDSPFEAERPVPIGRETRDSELLVLDPDRDEILPPGQVGRLMICGSQLAEGYWRRPDLTAQAFLPSPFKPSPNARMYETGDLAWKDEAGRIHYAGRTDSQVKIMGFRVELGEIEASLNAYPGIRESVAVLHGGDRPEILAAVILDDETDLNEGEILNRLQQSLPPYMLPRRVVPLTDLPRNINGKADRKAVLALLSGS